MFASTRQGQGPAMQAARPPAAAHPDPRDSADGTPWLSHMLDEIDYGMLLVNAQAQVAYANHAARVDLDANHPLQWSAGILGAHRKEDLNSLHQALASAQRGLRRLIALGQGESRVSISVVPMPTGGTTAARVGGTLTLLMLGKRKVCERLSVRGFAHSVMLTPAETRVLEQLCDGVRPTDIAAMQGVAVSTIRTQIGSIRAKTGAGSIRELVRQVAILPPLVGALRSGSTSTAS